MSNNTIIIQQLQQLTALVASDIAAIQGAGGNASVKDEVGNMYIKASGTLMKNITATQGYTSVLVAPIISYLKNESFDVTDSNHLRQLEKIVTKNTISNNKASMETSFHCLYPRFVLHTHNAYANILLCSSHYEQLYNIAEEEDKYTLEVLPNYYTPGSNLSWHIYNKYRYNEAMPNVTFLPNHGVIYAHNNILELCNIVKNVENKLKSFLKINTAYPTYTIENENRCSTVKCNFLFETWKKESWKLMLTDLLFPDQAIYLNKEEVSDYDTTKKVYLNFDKKTILIQCNALQAEGIVETMIAYYYIHTNIRANNFEPLTINSEYEVLRNMQSEQYRKEKMQ